MPRSTESTTPSPIPGYETRELVLGHLAALKAERPVHEDQIKEIARQIELFESEAARFEAIEVERLEREHETRLSAAKRGAWQPR
jgi:hypothetical protein